MKKFLIALGMVAALSLGGCKMISQASAQDCVSPDAMIASAQQNDIKFTSLREDVMKFVMSRFAEAHGNPPWEYEEIVVFEANGLAMIAFFNHACKVGQTNAMEGNEITDILKEASQ